MIATKKRHFRSLIILFLVIDGLVVASHSHLSAFGFDSILLICGNLLLFIIGLFSLYIQMKGAKATNPNAFVRAVYVVMILKLFIVAIAVLAYVLVSHRHINKPSLFTLMGLYIVYTIFEVKELTKILRSKNA